jgi:CD109 antigen
MTCDEVRPRLSWVLDGEAPDLEPHLAECPACRAELEKLRKADRLLAQAADRFAPRRRSVVPRFGRRARLRLAGRWIAAVASVLLVGFVAVWSWVNERTADPEEVLIFGSERWVAGTTGVLRVVVRDAGTQAPVAGARVRARLGDSQVEATSDGEGSAEVRLPAGETDGTVEISVDSPAGSDRLRHRISIERPVRMLLSTDKPLYQPSQTIHLRALALNSFTMKPHEGDVTLEIEDANGNRVFRRVLRSSAYGIASADFELADEVVLGTWRLRASVGATSSERTVEVKRYVLPKFKVALTPDRGFYEPGATFRADLEVQYTFGKPVANGDVRVELASWTGGTFVPFAQLSTRTDGMGKASVETTLPGTFFGTELERGGATLRIEAAVTDGAQHTERKAAASTVTREPIRIQAFPEGGEFVSGVPQEMFVVTSYPDGRPAPCTVTLDDRPGDFETDATGVLRLPVRSKGIVLQARDPKGHRGRLSTDLSSQPALQDFLLRTDRTSYRAGETMKLDVLAAHDGVVYVDLVKGGQTLLAKSVEVRKGRGALAVDLAAELFGTVRVSAYRIHRDGQITRDARLVIVDLPGDLQIRPTLRKPEFRPGEEIGVDFEVLDSKGQPVAAALGLAVVDEAVFALSESRPGLEKVYFQIEEDLLTPRYQLKGMESLELPATSPARVASAAVSDVTPLGRIGLEEKARELSRAKEEFNEAAETLLAWIAGLAAVGGLAWFVVWMRSLVGAGWLATVGSFVLLLFMAAMVLLPGTLKSQRASNELPGSYTAVKASIAADPVLADPVKPEVPRASGFAPRIRSFFPETLYWNPQIITDERGRASIAFPGADSITTWRMAMSAVTKSGELGTGEHGLRVFQPFFVDLDLPLALTQGDEVWLPIALYNYLQEPQSIALSLESEPGLEVVGEREKKIDVLPGDVTAVRFHVRAAAFGRFALTVKATGARFSDAVRRSIEVFPDGKEFPVSQSDRVVGRSRTTVTIPPEAIPGASRLFVRLFPSTFSEVVKGLEGLVQMPYG